MVIEDAIREIRVPEELFSVRVLRLKTGDAIAIKSQRKLTKEQAEMVTERVKEALGDRPVLVLPPEFDLIVVSESE